VRVIVVLNAPESHPGFITFAKHVVQCLSDTSLFPALVPPLSNLVSSIADLDEAQVAMLRTRGPADFLVV
jgi:hypothetical protein